MKELSSVERRALRARAHALRPIVMIGSAGLTDSVLKEIALALKSHELIKIRMLGEDRGARKDALVRICGTLDAAPVQLVGRMLVVFRPRPEPEPEPAARPKLRRKAPPRRTKRSFQRA